VSQHLQCFDRVTVDQGQLDSRVGVRQPWGAMVLSGDALGASRTRPACRPTWAAS
jgi:hypothetical protein